MTEDDSKIIILTSQTTDLYSTLIDTNDEFKDPSDREWPVSIIKELERLTKEKDELKEGKSKLKELACLCTTCNLHQFVIEDVIPEVARLAETTPLRYGEVLWICNEYGEGYKELIQKHIEAGTTHSAFDEMVAEIRTRKVIGLLEQEKLAEDINKQPVINLNERLSRTKKKDDKLPRKFRAGWKL